MSCFLSVQREIIKDYTSEKSLSRKRNSENQTIITNFSNNSYTRDCDFKKARGG